MGDVGWEPWWSGRASRTVGAMPSCGVAAGEGGGFRATAADKTDADARTEATSMRPTNESVRRVKVGQGAVLGALAVEGSLARMGDAAMLLRS